jgi:hypothetical protein
MMRGFKVKLKQSEAHRRQRSHEARAFAKLFPIVVVKAKLLLNWVVVALASTQPFLLLSPERARDDGKRRGRRRRARRQKQRLHTAASRKKLLRSGSRRRRRSHQNHEQIFVFSPALSLPCQCNMADPRRTAPFLSSPSWRREGPELFSNIHERTARQLC